METITSSVPNNNSSKKKNSRMKQQQHQHQQQVKLLDDAWLVSPDKLDPTMSSMKHLLCDRCSSRFSLIVSYFSFIQIPTKTY